MGVHAWCGHLDWAGPVKVVVAQGKRQGLKIVASQSRALLQWYVKVRWAHAALSAVDGHEEEIELRVVIRSSLLDEVSIYE